MTIAAVQSITFAPLNDLVVVATLRLVDHTTGSVTFLTSGTVTAFIATSNSPTATAADPSLSVTATPFGPPGQWLIAFDASLMTAALLNTLFGAGQTPYLIIQQTNAIRRYVPLTYSPGLAATITT